MMYHLIMFSIIDIIMCGAVRIGPKWAQRANPFFDDGGDDDENGDTMERRGFIAIYHTLKLALFSGVVVSRVFSMGYK